MARKYDLMTLEFLHREYVENGRTCEDIARDIGCDASTVQKRLASYGLSQRGYEDRYGVDDLTGTLVGYWDVQELVRRDGRVYYHCRCTFEDCGAIRLVPGNRLRSGNNRQSRMCEDCRRSLNALERYTGHEEISGRFWSDVEARARKLDRPLTITIAEAWDLFVAQELRCRLTGLPLSFAPTKYSPDEPTASLDRIDPGQGYIPGNVQWVHKDVNRMKCDLSESEFYKWCALIVAHHDRKEESEASQ
jgi:hypothetical protein